MKFRETAATFAGVVGTALLTGGGFLLHGAVEQQILAGLGINLAAALVAGGFHKLSKKWVSGQSGIMNHDIQRALVAAFGK